ncbi:MAG: CHASE3 domain-containing protein [Sphingomonadaceae bacterium]|nr:CHASE3 domain-containing protein [Sphingomonadaceae bacterium]
MTLTGRGFRRAVLGAMLVGFVLLLTAGGAALLAARESQVRSSWVVHTFEVERALDRLTILTEQLETARRGYLLWHHDTALSNYRARSHDIPAALDEITRLTRDNPEQRVRVAAIARLVESHRRSVQQTVERAESANLAVRAMADFSVDESFFSMRSLRTTIGAMKRAEEALLAERTAAEDRAGLVLNVVLSVTGALVLLVIGGALWVVLRYTADLDRSQDELRRLNTGLEEAVAARTAELSRANEEIQRFAYIVSHDLRSPLVNVMGFTAELEATIAPLTELIDRADAEAPALVSREARGAKADLPEAIGFIRASTQKMDRLINAILRLSREGRRTLSPASIDLAALTAAIRDSVQHRLGEVGGAIDVAQPMPPLVSDRLAIEQILSNLIENAIKYRDPARPLHVAVSGRREGERVIVDVADNGRGIAPADHERIFELFRRAGVQDQPGEGLGLAHVRALAYRLGGVITCISSLGQGATFRLSLPAVLDTEGVR